MLGRGPGDGGYCGYPGAVGGNNPAAGGGGGVRGFAGHFTPTDPAGCSLQGAGEDRGKASGFEVSMVQGNKSQIYYTAVKNAGLSGRGGNWPPPRAPKRAWGSPKPPNPCPIHCNQVSKLLICGSA